MWDRCTGEQLRRLNRLVNRIYDRELKDVGLKSTQFSLLAKALGEGAVTLTELAAHLGLDNSTLTRNVKPLVDMQLLQIRHSTVDARVKSVSLTPTGVVAVERGLASWASAQCRIADALGPDGVAKLHAALDEATQRIERFESPYSGPSQDGRPERPA